MNFFGTFGSTDAEALQLLLPVVDRALYAHQAGDYQEYLSVITSNLAAKITQEDFMRAHREVAPQLGTLQSKLLLAALRRGENPMLLFSAKFSGTEDDIVINITFKNGTKPPLIEWLWIE
ncbi:hypothetical protein [Motiliproteus sp. MSK22-1]|uniref:hypothetical protein n=1 Tax=Motiliproteus sp. MSK22-1 TaxID=1897630 RepID=UPI000978D1BC|nr:hypothetical protein [Motiliproteus sp. MSK22-1]OMH30554.1 hypothetical protein BGP75_17625 [Motiliproteus sp. MSK22-1]